ncbi:MAG TPA: M48 family metalloprotease [Solirubrobacteraceae bacterium]|nr:M48 family metalloprotease [Solirubrobacteraceae bacterium]
MSGLRSLWAAAVARPLRSGLAAATLALLAVAWVLAAHALWHSTVPSSLHLPHVDPRRLFSPGFLRRSASFERFLDVDEVLGDVTLIVVLALYAKRGHRLMRESAAGRIGTGMMLGMLGFAVLWIAEVPFDLAAVWWERRHGISHQGYVASLSSSFLSLGGTFLFVSLALLVTMAIAGVLRRWWWAVAAPIFAGLALLSTFLSVYLIPDTHPLRQEPAAAEVQRLARVEGLPGTKAEVQDVKRQTTAPNAESVGFGSTRRVILWDTLLDGRFDRREVDVVAAHELGHLAHRHPLKRVGWLALFLLPAAALVALFTRRRGGLARPEAVPVALFVFVVLQLLTGPLMNIVSRREEAEADWSALRATRDPAAARSLFHTLATTSLSNPDPPTWAYVLYQDHPTIVQRIAMVDAWQARQAH